MRSFASLLFFSALATSAFAHTIFQELYVNGVDQGHEVGIRVPTYDGPITDVTSNDLICNGGINPYQQPVSQTIIPVPAGASVTAEFHHTLAGADPSDPADPVDPSHKGPITAYLAKVPSATQTDVTGLDWFKIWEDGLTVSTQQWASDRMIANKGKVTFTIPECVEDGQYLLRVELIALHAASSYPGAQFYMECAQIQISGGGSADPATVPFPGTYHSTDPGITINIYQTLNNYTIPGPDVFTCDGSAPAPPTSSVSSTFTHPDTTTLPTTTSFGTTTSLISSPLPPPSSTPTGATAAHYAQCGGTGFTGPTVCAAPYTCVASNEYYSQCL